MTAHRLQTRTVIAQWAVTRQLSALAFAKRLIEEELGATPGAARGCYGTWVPKGEIWSLNVNPAAADFMADSKWDGYLEWADRFFWAVEPTFDMTFLPA